MRSKTRESALPKFIFIIAIAILCSNCSGRLVSPIDALPGSENYVGEYPNVHVHPSKPAKQPLTVQELDIAKQRLKNTR